MGRIPVFLYNDYAWIPSVGIDIESYGFIARVNGTNVNTVPDMIQKIKNLSDADYQRKLQHLHQVRKLFTYEGILEQIELFFKDPFGPTGGYLTCTTLPLTER